MLINGIELSSLGVELYDRVLSSNTINTVSDWLEGDIQPTFIRQQDKFKTMTLKFLVTEKNETNAFLVMSRLTAMLRKAEIVFDDIDLSFSVTTQGQTKQNRLKNGNFLLTVPLKSDYAKGATEVYTTDTVATSYFKLKILYYQDGNNLIATDEKIIKASDFYAGITFEGLGINVNKYKPNYYNNGEITNFSGRPLSYEELSSVQTLIVNYAPTTYYKEVEYFLRSDDGLLQPTQTVTIGFTKKKVDDARNIGDIIDLKTSKPDGYYATVNFASDLTFENLMKADLLQVYYEKIDNDQSKEITVVYEAEQSDGSYATLGSTTVIVKQSDIVLNSTLTDFINLDKLKPEKYYGTGYMPHVDSSAIVTYNSLTDSYDIRYDLLENSVYVEYYYGTYPNWNRITMLTYKFKYNSKYENSTDIVKDIGIDVNKYHTAVYEDGVIRNASLSTFDDVVNIGVIQVYYAPIDFTIKIEYRNDEDVLLETKEVAINDTMFLSEPSLAAIIDVNAARPEGYIYDESRSYSGAVTLGTLVANSPIKIYYKPVETVRTKSIVIKYQQELASAYSTINTSIITIEEAQVGGGTTLSALFDLNAYKPEYYNDGIVDGYSSTSLFTFDELQGEYRVLYLASTYSTQVRYYTDEISNQNWIGSEALKYKIFDFTTDTTLADLGLNINAFKPSYCGNGQVQYSGPVNFSALQNLDAINIIYEAISEPVDPTGIDYPHRILFLQHNDMGNYETDYPTWTLNHAYINTGVTCDDMSKLTVLVDTYRVFETEPLYNVNVGDAYLFGSITPSGSYYIKYVNNTKFKPKSELTGVNTFNIAAGSGTPELVVEESSSEGFSANTGITASSRDGYSYGTLTYTQLVQSNSAKMEVPLFLFACDRNGFYRGGIAGVGIKSCKIYYDNALIRDFVPVQFFDKIGDKTAPSNCLYDKVTQTFFEDATGKDSFNIMDDPAYTDTNPDHNIGVCYANYYKDDVLFNTSSIWFRESDFINGNKWNPYDKLAVDYFQPEYYGGGVITNLADLGDVTFNNVKNFVFKVQYKAAGYHITVKYWKDNKDSEANLLGSVDVPLTEKDFLQVPTFGQVVDILKYKPDGYKAIYNYNDSTGRVTLKRLLALSPFDIIYTKVENPKSYNFKVKYYKQKYAKAEDLKEAGTEFFTHKYYYIDEKTITLDETQFCDGVFVDKFIDLDAFYPMSGIAEPDDQTKQIPFYSVGEPYGWYLQDEMLDTPDSLQKEYRVIYKAIDVPIEIRYYTDEVDEDNLIASDKWLIKASDWPEDEQFQIVDELPNSYTDKYKPVICWGGKLQNPERYYTFKSLVEQGHLDFVYETKEEPHDPDSQDWPSKVLWFNGWTKTQDDGNFDSYYWDHLDIPVAIGGARPTEQECVNIFNPYINLGYTPKELGRLRTELKGYAACIGSEGPVGSYSVSGGDYATFFGYNSAAGVDDIIPIQTGDDQKQSSAHQKFVGLGKEQIGEFSIQGHSVSAGMGSYHNATYINFDGHARNRYQAGGGIPGEQTTGWDSDAGLETYREMTGIYQKGKSALEDIDGNTHKLFNPYTIRSAIGYGVYNDGYDDARNTADAHGSPWLTGVVNGNLEGPFVCFNPLTITLDAYNDYVEIYDYMNEQHPRFTNVENVDVDMWEYRGKPRGPISLFISTNPVNGQINWKPTENEAHLPIVGGSLNLQQAAMGNPYSSKYSPTVSMEQSIITGTTDDGTPIYEKKVITRTYAYAGWKVDSFPVVNRAMIWHIKIWDRNRLVRDLVPVAKGDQIYSFTAPANGLFDKVTEIFFSNNNDGGTYSYPVIHGDTVITETRVVTADQVHQLEVMDDPTIYGKITANYYDNNNKFLGNQYITIPCHYNEQDLSIAEVLHYNDYNPDTDLYHGGMLDVDGELKDINEYVEKNYAVIPQKQAFSGEVFYGYDGKGINSGSADAFLKDIFNAGSINIYYKLKTFTKTVVYYRGNIRVGSKDIFYSIDDIKKAKTLTDLGIDLDLYKSNDYKPGRVIFNQKSIAADDIKAFIDAPSPIVVYDEYTQEENPNLLYVDYYRGGAYDDGLITLNTDDPNYLDCDLTGKVMNPNGIVKYENHYHTALYEDETQDYFIAYQVDATAKYIDVHKGPARGYATLATITDHGRYTVIEERRGWGRLKEYPKGWILLSYTTRAIGPGQHPSYEDSKAVVSIPFATEISISKMTIDRLWGYCPEHACWLKMDEVSLDQTGKLYNGLGSQVIHLNEIADWSKIASLKDLGIAIDAYQLRYHDASSYNYSGDFTQDAFSKLHKIEIVYPETIYTCTCHYYKDLVGDIKVGDPIVLGTGYISGTYNRLIVYTTSNGYTRAGSLGGSSNAIMAYPVEIYSAEPKNDRIHIKVITKGIEGWVDAEFVTADSYAILATEDSPNELGALSFSYSLSDWNPDWPTFIASSWKYETVGIDGNAKVAGDATQTFYYASGNATKEMTAAGGTSVIFIGEKFTNEEGKDCYPVQYKDTNGWMLADSLNEIVPFETRKDTTRPINPTIYRDTEIRLSWDFFGIERNKFKPGENYQDGMFVWNPRTWDTIDNKFTFTECVTTGTQYVLYLPELVADYKAHFSGAYNSAGRFEGLTFPLDIKHYTAVPSLDSAGAIWDIETKAGEGFCYQVLPQEDILFNVPEESGIGTDLKSLTVPKANDNRASNDYYQITNISNKRNATIVVSTGNPLTKYQSSYFIEAHPQGSYSSSLVWDTASRKEEIKDTLNTEQAWMDMYRFNEDALKNYSKARNTVTFTVHNAGVAPNRTLSDITFKHVGCNAPDNKLNNTPQAFWADKDSTWVGASTKTSLWYLKVWKNYFLQHYYIPLPRGYRLPQGSQIPFDTFYDVITHAIVPKTVRDGDSSIVKYDNPTIYLANKQVSNQNKIDYFAGWKDYTVTDVTYVIQTTAAVQGYEVPDTFSLATNKFDKGTVIPVNGETSDSEHFVKGKWYRAYNGTWFQADNTTILASDKYTITAVNKNLAIKAGLGNNKERDVVKTLLYYLTPDGKETSTQKFNTETIKYITAACGDFYFSNIGWLSKADTEENVEAITDKTYAVSVDKLAVYKHPVKNEAYFIKNLQEGDRIQPSAKLVRDSNWQRIADGWIDAENTISEIV